MFMQRIDLPVDIVAPPPSPPSRLRTLAIALVGMAFIAVMAPAMLCYWIAVFLWVGAHATVRAASASARLIRDTVNFTGGAIVGR